MNKIIIWSLLCAVMFVACTDDAEISTISSTPTITVVDAPELIIVDEKIGEIVISFLIEGDQSLDAEVLVSIDGANTTAVNGVDFDFHSDGDGTEVIAIPAYIKYGTFSLTISDDIADDKDNFITLNIGVAERGPTVSNTVSTRIEIANFESDEIQLINDWATEPLVFEIANTQRTGGQDVFLWGTGLNADNAVTGFTFAFTPDTVVTENFDTNFVYDEPAIIEVDPCDVDFDIYYYNAAGDNVAANWNNCPEIAYVQELTDGTGYSMSNDAGAAPDLPYGTYTATLDLWSNGYAINSYEALGEVFAGFHVVDLQNQYPTNFENWTTAYREGFYSASAETSEFAFNVGIGGFGLAGGGISTASEKAIYTVDLQPGMITVNYINGDEILSGRQAQQLFEHPVKDHGVEIDWNNLTLDLD